MHKITFILLVIGGLNWLLEAFGYGLGGWGLPSSLVMIIYVLVGLSAIYEIFSHKSNCKSCAAGTGI
ncbi:MAG TPA: DUF378 domain-containing protein [Candidatus Paceibacterota bacterium]